MNPHRSRAWSIQCILCKLQTKTQATQMSGRQKSFQFQFASLILFRTIQSFQVAFLRCKQFDCSILNLESNKIRSCLLIITPIYLVRVFFSGGIKPTAKMLHRHVCALIKSLAMNPFEFFTNYNLADCSSYTNHVFVGSQIKPL